MENNIATKMTAAFWLMPASFRRVRRRCMGKAQHKYAIDLSNEGHYESPRYSAFVYFLMKVM
jgi:hypothetical protein